MAEQIANEAQPVSFGERLATSQVFSDLFRDGMALVEETAGYLDSAGRQDSKKLDRSAALAEHEISSVRRGVVHADGKALRTEDCPVTQRLCV